MSHNWQQSLSGSTAEMSAHELEELLNSLISVDCPDNLPCGDGVCAASSSEQFSPISSSDSDSGIDGSPAVDYMDSACDSVITSSDSSPSNQFWLQSPISVPPLSSGICPLNDAQSPNHADCSQSAQSFDNIQSLSLPSQSSLFVATGNGLDQSSLISPPTIHQSPCGSSDIDQSAFSVSPSDSQSVTVMCLDSGVATSAVSVADSSIEMGNTSAGGKTGVVRQASKRCCLPVIRIKRSTDAPSAQILSSTRLPSNPASLVLGSASNISKPATVTSYSFPVVSNPALSGSAAIYNSPHLSAISTSLTPNNCLVSNPASLVSNPASLVSNPASLVSSPILQVTNPASIVTNPASLVSSPILQVTNPASIVTNPASLVSNPASIVSNSALLVTCPASLASSVSTDSVFKQNKVSRKDSVQPIIPQPSASIRNTPNQRTNKEKEEERYRRKHEQALRNRLAASQSRQRKQHQLLQLQHANQQLTRDNQLLRDENDALHVRVAELETELALIRTCNSPPPSPAPMGETFSQQQQRWRQDSDLSSSSSPVSDHFTFDGSGSSSRSDTRPALRNTRRAVLFSLLLLTTVSVRPLLWQQLRSDESTTASGDVLRVTDFGIGNSNSNSNSSSYSGRFASRTLLWTSSGGEDTDNIPRSNLSAVKMSGSSAVNTSSMSGCVTYGLNASEALRIDTALRNVFRLPRAIDPPGLAPWGPASRRRRRWQRARASLASGPVGGAAGGPSLFLDPLGWLTGIVDDSKSNSAYSDGGFLLSSAGAAPWRPSKQLLASIDRQPDRYYVVWMLSEDSLLLLPPVSGGNRTSWSAGSEAAASPRVSVLLPTSNTADFLADTNSTRTKHSRRARRSRGASTTLLEIDCRVLRTRTVHVPLSLDTSSATPTATDSRASRQHFTAAAGRNSSSSRRSKNR